MRLPGLNLYEQGAGKLSVVNSKAVLEQYVPRASLVPASLNFTGAPACLPTCLPERTVLPCRRGIPTRLPACKACGPCSPGCPVLAPALPRHILVPAPHHTTHHHHPAPADCPYMWPFCRQPLYATAMPLMFNATILNGLGLTGRLEGAPAWTPADDGGRLLDVRFEYSEQLWPWSGYLALFIRVRDEGAAFQGSGGGEVAFTVVSPPAPGEAAPRRSTVRVPLTVGIIPTPDRWAPLPPGVGGLRRDCPFLSTPAQRSAPCPKPCPKPSRASQPRARFSRFPLTFLSTTQTSQHTAPSPAQEAAPAVGPVPLHPLPARLLPAGRPAGAAR